MNYPTIILIIFGLALFETVNSIDNAVINAEVLTTMNQKSRHWFLVWGMLIAVFLIRGVLPWLIVWLSTPGISGLSALTATFSSNQTAILAIERSAPFLLISAGTFLLFLFFHWLFVEPKNFGLRGERFISQFGGWFYAVSSIALLIIVRIGLNISPSLAFGAVIGSTGFFIVHGFKQYAEVEESRLKSKDRSDLSKIFYLEVIDSAFSIDGVLGAFAFTLSIPLILIGNGLGALIVRKLTVSNIDKIKNYLYLKNGAMYSILCLGMIMLLDSFGYNIPSFISPIITALIIFYFYTKSKNALKI